MEADVVGGDVGKPDKLEDVGSGGDAVFGQDGQDGEIPPTFSFFFYFCYRKNINNPIGSSRRMGRFSPFL